METEEFAGFSNKMFSFALLSVSGSEQNWNRKWKLNGLKRWTIWLEYLHSCE